MACLFCDIASKRINADIFFEDAHLVAFNDINPQAPIHQLIIPKRHISTLNDTLPEDAALLGRLLLCAMHLAKEANIAVQGYRTVINCNKGGGQEIYHLHLHLLAGRALHWPPG